MKTLDTTRGGEAQSEFLGTTGAGSGIPGPVQKPEQSVSVTNVTTEGLWTCARNDISNTFITIRYKINRNQVT